MSLEACLLGTAIGDALGLPYEGLSPRRARRLLGPPDRLRLLPGWGMVSDDTEHACLTAQALIASAGSPDVFARDLARRLRLWLLALPPGVGFATVRGIVKSAVGVPPARSGVWSAGNGPCMRAPIIGAAVRDVSLIQRLVRASTAITHLDPQAEYGAVAVALAARHAARNEHPDGAGYLGELTGVLPPDAAPLARLLERAVEHARGGQAVSEFSRDLGLGQGVTGYVNHTVPVVICSWLRHAPDLRSAVVACIECGGDTDTTAAIVGGIVGAGLPASRLPADLLDRLFEWPRTVTWMRRLAKELDEARESAAPIRPPDVPFAAAAARNIGLLAIVLIHGLRRLLPPYDPGGPAVLER